MPEQVLPLPHPPQLAELPHAVVSVPHWFEPHEGAGQTHELFEHASSAPHPPQLTVRCAPQLSVPVTMAHWAPCARQNWSSDCGVQHVLLVHTCPELHVPQLMVRWDPHRSVTVRLSQVALALPHN